MDNKQAVEENEVTSIDINNEVQEDLKVLAVKLNEIQSSMNIICRTYVLAGNHKGNYSLSQDFKTLILNKDK